MSDPKKPRKPTGRMYLPLPPGVAAEVAVLAKRMGWTRSFVVNALAGQVGAGLTGNVSKVVFAALGIQELISEPLNPGMDLPYAPAIPLAQPIEPAGEEG